MLRRRFLARSLAAASALSLACGCYRLPSWFFGQPPSTNYSGTCRNNLRALATAVFMWETRTGRKLPPYVADSAGRPLLSWRVLVLPELDRTPLFNLFHLDEPWDSPHNRPLAARIEQFICPLSQVGQQKSSPLTNYLAVTGEGTFWSGDEPASSSVSAGQPDAGMLIVECNQSAVVWSEPRDLDVSQLQFRYTSTMSPGLSSKHANRAVNVALNDMTVIPISPQEYDAEALGDFAYRLGSPQRPEKHSLRWREWMNR